MPWPKGVPHTAEMKAKRVATYVQNGKRRRKPRVVGGVEQWQCSRCKAWFTVAKFYHDDRPSGLSSQCRSCHIEGNIRTRDPELARTIGRAHMRRARATNPEKFRAQEREASRSRPRDQKYKARVILNAAVRSGELLRPNSCQRCGSTKGRIEGHHPDYSLPLEVVWLCSECHGLRHRKVANG